MVAVTQGTSPIWRVVWPWPVVSSTRRASPGPNMCLLPSPQPKHRLFSLPSVIFTPHTAGPTWENYIARFRNGFDNIQRVASGRPPLWVVAGEQK